MNLSQIAQLLRLLASVATLPALGGDKGEKLALVLNSAASLAELPAELEPQRKALVAMVQLWVDENRAPTDAELDQLKATRDELDAQLRQLQAELDRGA